MGRAANTFAATLCKELNRLSDEKKSSVAWKCGGPINSGHECVDVTGWYGERPRVLVEIELRRQTPLANIAKIWKWIDDEKQKHLKKNIVVIQAFSRYYRMPKSDARVVNAKFIGKQMEKGTKARYIDMDLDFRPGKSAKKGAGARRTRAKKFASQIVQKLKNRI
jgi:hypothetical protein